MGFWGTKLYQNDYTEDIKDAFVVLIKRKDIEETITIIKNDFYDDDPDYEPLFWYAFSDMLKEYGFLDEDTLKKTLEWINKKGGINLWETKKQKEKWIIELDKLKTKLLDNTIIPKKVKKNVIFNHHPWEIGDYVAYKFNSKIAEKKGLKGKYIVFQKIDNVTFGHSDYVDDEECIYSMVVFFNYIFDEIPSINEIRSKSILSFVDKYVSETELTAPDIVQMYEKNIIIISNKRSYKENDFYVLGNREVVYNCSDHFYGDLFLDIKFEEDIIYFLEIWENNEKKI